MFSKLLKYEWKANAGLLGILSLCALGAGLLGGFVLKAIIHINEKLVQEDVVVWGSMGLSSALMFIIVALAAYAFAVQFINLFRFYKHKFTDEGYLTFTLPVTPRQIFLSSFLNILVWMLISTAVVVAAAAMIIFIGAGETLAEYAVDLSPLFSGMAGVLEEGMLDEPGGVLYLVTNIVSTTIAPVYSVIMLMTSITIGCVLAKKHKILATIGMYYCINFAVNMVESILGVVPMILMGLAQEQPYVYLSTNAIIGVVLQIGLAIGGYFLSTHLMKHKLNLP